MIPLHSVMEKNSENSDTKCVVEKYKISKQYNHFQEII